MSGGLSKARLTRMQDRMSGHVERGYVPGILTLVSRRGDTHVHAVGSKALDRGDPMRRDTIFRITSMTKPITAVATMILVEDCKLRLDEPIERLLPELANRRVLKSLESPLDDTVPASRSVIVRDLLTFRLGLGIIFGPPNLYPIQRAINDMAITGFGPPMQSTPHDPDEWMRRDPESIDLAALQRIYCTCGPTSKGARRIAPEKRPVLRVRGAARSVRVRVDGGVPGRCAVSSSLRDQPAV
jgi:hypothetical protein